MSALKTRNYFVGPVETMPYEPRGDYHKVENSSDWLDQPQKTALDVQIGGHHYKDCKIQPVEFIEANGIGFLEGCVIKRLARHGKPTGKGMQDIEKSIHELQLLLQFRYPTAMSDGADTLCGFGLAPVKQEGTSTLFDMTPKGRMSAERRAARSEAMKRAWARRKANEKAREELQKHIVKAAAKKAKSKVKAKAKHK